MANPDQDIEGLLAHAGDASMLVHDGGLFTTRQHHSTCANLRTSKQWWKTQKAEKPTCTQRALQCPVWGFGRKPQLYRVDFIKTTLSPRLVPDSRTTSPQALLCSPRSSTLFEKPNIIKFWMSSTTLVSRLAGRLSKPSAIRTPMHQSHTSFRQVHGRADRFVPVVLRK